jgi:sensor histidine kinase YesM
VKKLYFHILFWVFIYLYEFDYIIDLYSPLKSIVYSACEVSVYCAEFYINLLVLMPFILIRKGKIAYTLSLLILLIVGFSTYYITGLNKVLSPENFQRAIVSFLLNHSLFIFISYIVWFFNKYLSEKQMRLQLENEKLQLEMSLLKSQISPHFLFNALNNIYSLTLIKSDDAPKMLSSLSDLLRYFIYESNKKRTFLTSEIELINKYIEIQKYRQVAGMCNILFNVSGDISGVQVPPLLFILLVENAFKHGDIIENKNGFVNINLSVNEGKIDFTVANSFQPNEKGNGIGLKNLESQLKNLFNNNYQLKIESNHSIFKVSMSFYGI